MFDILIESNPNHSNPKEDNSIDRFDHSPFLGSHRGDHCSTVFHGNLESGKVRYLSCCSPASSSPATPAAGSYSQSCPDGQIDSRSERKDSGSRIHPPGDCHGCR